MLRPFQSQDSFISYFFCSFHFLVQHSNRSQIEWKHESSKFEQFIQWIENWLSNGWIIDGKIGARTDFMHLISIMTPMEENRNSTENVETDFVWKVREMSIYHRLKLLNDEQWLRTETIETDSSSIQPMRVSLSAGKTDGFECMKVLIRNAIQSSFVPSSSISGRMCILIANWSIFHWILLIHQFDLN